MSKLTREEIIEGVASGKSFEGEKIQGVNLKDANLRGGNFANASFRYTDLQGADLFGADLKGANLRHVVFHGANLGDADLRDADLEHADLRGSNVTNVKLQGAKLQGARGISTKVFFTQEQLDKLNEKNKIELDGLELTILTGDNPTFKIHEAYRVVKVDSGEDEQALLGKVKTAEDLESMEDVEIYMESLIVGETVYTLEAGFIGVPLRTAAPPVEEQQAAAPATEDKTPTRTEPASTSPTQVEAVPQPPAAAQAAPPTKQEQKEKTDEELLSEFLLKNI
jgi:Pentapeptide repeats (8 copies)